ncbi:MAG: hypothetical protein U0800_24955 [Isosphaeraceae bacterium]
MTAPADPILAEELCKAVGVETPRHLVTAIYSGEFDRTRIASLAPVVVSSASRDAEVLGAILAPAGRELAHTVLAVARSIGWPEGGELPLAMAGGFLLSAKPVSDAMLEELARNRAGTVRPARVEEPALGAVVLARRDLRS